MVLGGLWVKMGTQMILALWIDVFRQVGLTGAELVAASWGGICAAR